jgi:hypothetical protein
MAQFTIGQAVTHKQGAGTGEIIRLDAQHPGCAWVRWTVPKGKTATKTFTMYMRLELVNPVQEG